MTRTLRTLSVALILVVAISFAGCSRDKQKYLDSAQRYVENGKVDQAIVEFRNALSVDPNYAEAH